jgi:hypothetical protein
MRALATHAQSIAELLDQAVMARAALADWPTTKTNTTRS